MKKRSNSIAPKRIERSIQSRFQPLANLTPERLTAMLDAFNAGYLAEAARTWEAMIRRDDRLQGLVNKRLSAVARYGFDVVTVDGDEGLAAEAAAHKEKIEYFLNNLTATNALDENQQGGFSLLVRQMATAIGMRYAVHEIVWQPGDEGLTAAFRHVPLWFFENRTGRLRFLEQDYGVSGIEMPADEWLVTVGAGLMEASSVAWMYKRLPLRDWLSYSEKFGFPGVLGKTNAAHGTAEWRAMEDAVRIFSAEFAAVCNASEAIELIEAKGGANMPFPELIERMDKALAIMWRGGDLGTASGTGADNTGASLQGTETDLIEQDDAAWLSEALQTSVIRQVVEYHFGRGVRPLAYVQIRTKDRKNTDMDLKVLETLSRIGLPLAKAPIYERFGLPVPEPGEETLGGAPVASPPPPAETLANEVAASLGVPEGWVTPIESLLREMKAKAATATPAEWEEFLQETQARLPELLDGLAVEELAAVFEGALGGAVLEGVRQAVQRKPGETL
jgi:phage gp29-like protein